jgi:hypothetical protein
VTSWDDSSGGPQSWGRALEASRSGTEGPHGRSHKVYMMAFQETRELLLNCSCRVALVWSVNVITNVIDSSGWTLTEARNVLTQRGYPHGWCDACDTDSSLLFAAVQRSSTIFLQKIDNSFTRKWITHTWITAIWTMAAWITVCLAWTTATSAT